ncbi:MAG: hypothetical protein A2144_01940 [Chloroflexi bacterium RBG_16_50_9]|nr:MAG: hypothetical protein A2144_01940 [Chloroflexi bacterium RBG_16_50_9]
MEDKIIVLGKDGQWLALENCFLVGAVEFPEKVVYYKFMFSRCDEEMRSEMLRRAEQYLNEVKKGRQ